MKKHLFLAALLVASVAATTLLVELIHDPGTLVGRWASAPSRFVLAMDDARRKAREAENEWKKIVAHDKYLKNRTHADFEREMREIDKLLHGGNQ